MRRAVVLSLLFLLAFGSFSSGQERIPHRSFSADLLVGYTPMPSSIYKVRWEQVDLSRREVRTGDSSYINPAPLAGLALSYLPPNAYIHLGFTIEGFYMHNGGRFKGGYGDNPERQEPYAFHAAFDFYQLNMLCTVFFTDAPFKPFIQAGIGALRNDVEIEGSAQTAWGGSAIASWGAQYHVAEWFALGGQIRVQDMFGLEYSYDVDPDNSLDIKAQYVLISVLLQTTFYF